MPWEDVTVPTGNQNTAVAKVDSVHGRGKEKQQE